MNDYQVGDQVTVYRNTRQVGGGKQGEIVKVGRTLVHIRSGNWQQAFRMDTQYSNEEQYGHGTYFRTEEQVLLAERKEWAVGVLREHKVILNPGHNLSLEQIEALADVAKDWEV